MQYNQEKLAIGTIKRMYSNMSCEADGLNILEHIFDLTADASPEFKAFLESIQKLVIDKMGKYPGVSYKDALAKCKIDDTHTAMDLLGDFVEALTCASYDEIVYAMNFIRYEKDRTSAMGICAFLNAIRICKRVDKLDKRWEEANFVALNFETLLAFKVKPIYYDDNNVWDGYDACPLIDIKKPDSAKSYIFEKKNNVWVWIGKDIQD